MKTASFGQGLAVAARLAECFPRDIPKEDLQDIIDDPSFLREYLGGIHRAFATRIPTIPEVNVEFELTLEQVTGLAMVQNISCVSTGWQFKGSEITEPRTGRFKLVQVGFNHNLCEVKKKLAEHGEIPQGQWREAFKARFPKIDFNGAIGVSDPSWVNPHGEREFPYIDTYGCSLFREAGRVLNEDWRWLVHTS